MRKKDTGKVMIANSRNKESRNDMLESTSNTCEK